MNEDVWALLCPRRAEAELDDATILDRTLHPFADPQLFPAGRDLGPFEAYRHSVDRERVGTTTRTSLIEPKFGWVISRPFHLVERGLINIHNVPAPSVRAYLRARWEAGPREMVPPVINLRDRGEHIYGHVMQDLVGGRLRLAAERGLDDLPILISKRLFDRRFFQDLLRLSGLADRTFVLQEDEHVRTRKVYLFDTSHYARASTEYLQRLLPVPDADLGSNRRIFIVRKPGDKAGRGLSNMVEVADVCRRFGFEMISTDDLGLEEQIELFSQARFVVGVHGSALMNIVFRKGSKLTLLEIAPPGADLNRPRPVWFYVAAVVGHDHQLLHAGTGADGVTGKAAYRRDFSVDTDRLAAAMTSVLDRA